MLKENKTSNKKKKTVKPTFPTQRRTFVTLGSELGGKAPRPILWNDSKTMLRS